MEEDRVQETVISVSNQVKNMVKFTSNNDGSEGRNSLLFEVKISSLFLPL